MKRILLNFALKHLVGGDYPLISSARATKILDQIIEDELLGDVYVPFLKQCADESRNKYMYTDDTMYKGMALAFTLLKEQIEARKQERKKRNKPDNKPSAVY